MRLRLWRKRSRRHGGRGENPAVRYRESIADFLAVHSFKQEHQGYPAFEGELVADGEAMRPDRKLIVFVSAVLCEWPEETGIRPVPSFWFLVVNEADELDSFAVEAELLIEALENADPDLSRRGQIPIPAVEAKDPGADRVLAGKSLYLKVSATRVEPFSDGSEPRLPAGAILFVVGGMEGEREKAPAYSFAMAGLSPFLALDASLDRYAGPTSFALELDEFAQEIERAPEG